MLEARANAVLGYRQFIDLERETCIVMRAIGTMATLEPLNSSTPPNEFVAMGATPPGMPAMTGSSVPSISPSPLKYDAQQMSGDLAATVVVNDTSSSVEAEDQGKHRTTLGQVALASTPSSLRPTQLTSLTAWHMSERLTKHAEFPFFTLTSLPPGVVLRIGGACVVRSVELLDRFDNADEPETRDAWWRKLRQEMLAHAHNWGCNAIIGYEESTALCDELCVLSAYGTAVLLHLNEALVTASWMMAEAQPLSSQDDSVPPGVPGSDERPSYPNLRSLSESCSVLHVPYQHAEAPFHHQEVARCGVCGHGTVPDVLLSTTEMFSHLAIVGRGCLIQARVCRQKKKATGEANAYAVSAALPFLEHNLHRQLILKLECIGMNAVFGLRTQLSIGERLIVATATGTAVCLAALPIPRGVRVQQSSSGTEVQSVCVCARCVCTSAHLFCFSLSLTFCVSISFALLLSVDVSVSALTLSLSVFLLSHSSCSILFLSVLLFCSLCCVAIPLLYSGNPFISLFILCVCRLQQCSSLYCCLFLRRSQTHLVSSEYSISLTTTWPCIGECMETFQRRRQTVFQKWSHLPARQRHCPPIHLVCPCQTRRTVKAHHAMID